MDIAHSQVILRPFITEKTEKAQAHSQYTFLVNKASNKIIIKNAVSALYNTVVRSVRIIPIRKKIRKAGAKLITKRNAGVKAIVTLVKGKTIDPMKLHIKSEAKKTKK